MSIFAASPSVSGYRYPVTAIIRRGLAAKKWTFVQRIETSELWMSALGQKQTLCSAE